jgi:glycosyltransferase involved in cell wall biosynthesis
VAPLDCFDLRSMEMVFLLKLHPSSKRISSSRPAIFNQLLISSMSSPSQRTQVDRLDRYRPYLRFLRDLAFSLADIFSQCTTIRPWYLVLPVLALKLLVVVSYTYGSNVDHHVPTGVDGLVVVRGERGCYLFEADRDEEEREKRMGVLGQPVCEAGAERSMGTAMPNGHVSSTPSSNPKIKIAVVCPVYLANDEDTKSLHRVHQSLLHQTHQPDLILFVDDGSPLPRESTIAQKQTKTSSAIFHVFPFPRGIPPPPRHDPYEILESDTTTRILRLAENRSPAAARNRGIDHAVAALGDDPGHTLIFLLDVDCVAPPEWIENGVAAVLARRPGIMDGRPVEPLLVGGLTYGINPASFFSFYHDLFGTLNPRIIRVPDPTTAQYQPLYAPTCNMVILPGDAGCGKKLPRFHEGFREAAQEDVLFCLEAVYGRGCELVMDKVCRYSILRLSGTRADGLPASSSDCAESQDGACASGRHSLYLSDSAKGTSL